MRTGNRLSLLQALHRGGPAEVCLDNTKKLDNTSVKQYIEVSMHQPSMYASKEKESYAALVARLGKSSYYKGC